MSCKVTLLYFVVISYVSPIQRSLALEIDSLCMAWNEPGVCKAITDCEYLNNWVTIEEKKPPMCYWEGLKRIVCCPLKDHSHTLGVFGRDYFNGTKDGVLYSSDATCRYSGTPPMLCCEKEKRMAAVQEPAACPKLDLPKIDRKDIAWKKCLEYQRYVNMCVSSPIDSRRYVRENTCGISTTGDRIAEGTPAGKTEFPHMALLGCRDTVNVGENHKPIAWVAGGSLISEKYILTAAHALVHKDYGPLRYALLGAVNKSEAREGELFTIIRNINHKLYVSDVMKYDIALIELNRRVEFSEFIHPACLPMPGLDISEERIIAGWGNTGSDASESEILLKAVIFEQDYDTQCKQHLDKKDFTWDARNMICASAGPGLLHDSCKGDSGGPLMAYSAVLNCTYVVQGVVSWGPPCGKGTPGVYSKVEYYLGWIIENVWPDE